MSNHTKGLIITALGVLVISPDGLLTRLITADALTITFWRGLFYSVGMLFILTAYYRKNIMDAFFAIGLPGLCMVILYAVGNLSFIYSITHTTVANTLFIISTTPLFAALISWLFFKEQVAVRTWVAIIVTAIGIYIICDGPSIMPDAAVGNLAGLLAALSLATSFTIVAKNRDRDLLPSFVLSGFLMALMLEPFVMPSRTTDSDLFYLFIMGFFLIPVASTLMFIGPKYISAPEVSLMLLLESIFGPLWVWLVLQEHPGNHALAGGTLILLTLAIHSVMTMRPGVKLPIDK